MADPVEEVQAISATKRSPILAMPVESPSRGGPADLTREEVSKPVAPVDEGGETQDLVSMTTLREKVKQLVAQWSPVRISFVVDRETREVRIRVIDVKSGEIIREVPPGQTLTPQPPEDRPLG